MNEDKGFSFSVPEVIDLLRLQSQWRKEEALRVKADAWAKKALEALRFRP